MCGIAGIVMEGSRRYAKAVAGMTASLAHRGPDGRGEYYFPDCALAHTRLSIVDLETGEQPMVTDDQKHAISFNGEIYGYRELRKELSDYPFRTTSDTETILALYRAKGEECLEDLPGMFAFALWDDSRKKLFCARDRFGEKPFYYAIGKNGEFVFASEIKAILATGLVKPELSRGSLIHYLKHLYVHPHRTIYDNVHTLPPAHRLVYESGDVRVERYWKFPELDFSIGKEEAVEKFKSLLGKAVSRQLIADVPVGAFLSGGLDSTTITAVASGCDKKLRTFSFGFEGVLNELPYARDAAAEYETDHVEVTSGNVDIGELLLEMANVYDEPFADSSNIPTYVLCKLARQYGKSILTGDGGDELLAGYTFWYNELLLKQPRYKPSPVTIILAKIADWILKRTRVPLKGRWKDRIGTLSRLRRESVRRAHARQNVFFSDADITRLGLDSEYEYGMPTGCWTETGTVDDAFRMDVEDYMPGDILVKVDRASMAHGLELRAPFLDAELASFCLSLPAEHKIDMSKSKILLSEAFSEAWPVSIRGREKQGFGAPVGEWLRNSSVRELKQRYLMDPDRKLFQFISFQESERIIRRDNYQTWILLVLSIWMETHDFNAAPGQVA